MFRGMEAPFLKRLSSLLFLSALSFVSSASAGVIWTDGLTTPALVGGGNQYAVTAGTTLGNLTVSQANVDYLVTPDYTGSLCGGLTACIDLDGTPGIGGVTSSVNFATPGTYVLSFYLFSAQRGTTASTTVAFGGLVPAVTYTDGAAVNGTPNGLVTETFNVASTGSYTLSFTSLTGGNSGSAGDLVGGISIAAPNAVPEPSTMLLLSLPLLVSGSKAFRRSRS